MGLLWLVAYGWIIADDTNGCKGGKRLFSTTMCKDLLSLSTITFLLWSGDTAGEQHCLSLVPAWGTELALTAGGLGRGKYSMPACCSEAFFVPSC